MLEPKKTGRPTKKPSIAELDMLYRNMTVRELANHYEVAEVTVRRWIAAYRKELREKKGEI